MRVTTILILLIFQISSPLSKEISAKDVEELFLSEIKKENPSNEDKFLLFTLAARELYNYQYYNKSKEYYNKAIDLKTTKDHTEVYLNLMAIEYSTEKKVSKKNYESALAYFTKTNKINDPGIEKYMNFIESNFFHKSGGKDFSGFYGEFTRRGTIDKLIKDKKYKEALALINTLRMDERDLYTKVRYDLLRSVVLGKKKLALFCKPSLDKFPHSIAWTIEMCKILVSYQSGRTPSKKDLKKLRDVFKEQQKARIYLVNVFGDLK